jgi:hypothetical protein
VKFFAREVRTEKLFVGETCVTPEQFAEVFGGSRAPGAPENTQSETPSGSPAPVATKDADTGTSTTPSATTIPPIEEIANKPEPADASALGEGVEASAGASEGRSDTGSVEDTASTDAPPVPQSTPEPELAPANDNQPADPLPTIGTN